MRHVSSMTSQRGKSVPSPRSASASSRSYGCGGSPSSSAKSRSSETGCETSLPGVFARTQIVTPAWRPMRRTMSSWPGLSRRWPPQRAVARAGAGSTTSVAVTGRALPGADEDRDSRPAPVLDLEPERGERLRVGVRGDTLDVAIALVLATDRPDRVGRRHRRRTRRGAGAGSHLRRPTAAPSPPSASTWRRWFWTTSRIAPTPS